MKFFIDTADVNEIREANALGVLDGVTTNPSLVAKSGRNFIEVLKEITEIVDGPISAEVVALDHEGMIREALELAAIHPNIVVKVPMTPEGLKAVKALHDKGIKTNVTLIFSPLQALLAAKAGAILRLPLCRPPRRHLPGRHGNRRRDPHHLRQLRLRDGDYRCQRPQPDPCAELRPDRRRHRHHSLSRSSPSFPSTP